MHIQMTHLCSEDPRGSSCGGKGDRGLTLFLSLFLSLSLSLSLSSCSCIWPRPRVRFVDGKRLRSFSVPFRFASYCTREHNYATRCHSCTNTMHEHHAFSSLRSRDLPFASPGRALMLLIVACSSFSRDS